MKRLGAFFSVLFFLTTSLVAQRLPQTASPSHYSLHFTPDLKTATFEGDETIDLKISQPTDSIAINAVEIKFNSVEVVQNGQTLTGSATTDDESGIAKLHFSNPLAAGAAQLKIKFTGFLNDKLRGFYLSKGESRRYATTQFEPTDARRAFPSFDEPSYKATFDISLTIDAGDTAISNGAIAKDEPGPGATKHTLTFATSPKMSTYLVAMAVGDWKCSTGEQDDIPVRVCSTPDKVALTPYALKSAKEILHFYNSYYGIRYPFKKLDVLAVPDFEAGAMENTAAIFYRETLLLIDDQHSSVGAHKAVFDVLAHEMAHQWFGDLVTMAWWNDIWLNEGFATWMTAKPEEALHPEWKADVEEASDTANTLSVDSRTTTRAIRQQATTSGEINQLFDGIAYGKTAAVLRMVEHYTGTEPFRKGVNAYLAAHAYGNATGEDFWNTVAHESGKPVDAIFVSYTQQAGAPLLTVTPKCGNKNTVEFSEQRFFEKKADLGSAPTQSWAIPVCQKSADGSTSCALWKGKQGAIPQKSCALGTYLNADGRGFYRTQYSPEALKALSLAKLNPQERIMLLSDEWALARTGQESIANFMNISQRYSHEPDGLVLGTILSRLNTAYTQLVDDSDRAQFQQYLSRTFSPVLQQIGLDAHAGEAPEISQLRIGLYNTLGRYANDPAVLEHAHDLALKYLENPESIDPTIANVVLMLPAIHGDAGLYDKYLAALPKMKSPEQHYAVFYALTYFSDPKLVERTVQWATTNAVRNQDAASVFSDEIYHPESRDAGWKIVKANWPGVSKQFTTWSGSEVVGATGSFCTEADKQDVQQFFASHKVEASERTLRQAIDQIDTCISFKKEQGEDLKQWLQAAK